MSGSKNAPVPGDGFTNHSTSAWAPLRESLFRSLWIASLVSYTGTWMQNVGAGWLMTQLTLSPLMVSLVQAAATLPVFLVILPAGALADLVDRRRFLLITQAWMVIAAGALGILTILHLVTPWILLLLTFLLGLGAVMNDPAWQAITPEVVSSSQFAPAVALNSVGYNIARAVGPAVGGFIVAAAGSGTAFILNAASFFGVIFFLYSWKRPHHARAEQTPVSEALREGLRYGRSARLVHCVLIRTGAFSLGASSLLALLPILARPHGASGYGILLASFGVGALAGGAILPHLRRGFSVDGLIAGSTLVFAAMTFLAGWVQSFVWLNLSLFASGMAWIGILACLNVAAQTMSPPGLRARALSMYLLVLQGGMAVGSAIWGALATRTSVADALMFSAATLVIGLLAFRRFRITSEGFDLAPAVVRD